MRITSLFVAFGTTALAGTPLVAQTWTQLAIAACSPSAPNCKPSPRRAGAMAFDVQGNRMLIYGGTIASPGQVVNETWTWNGAIWSKLNPATQPPPRWGHRLVRDTGNNRLFTFGGRSPTVSGLANDVWTWNGTNWSALPVAVAPTPRFGYGMVYDSQRSRVVLFGGRTNLGNSKQTWEFDGLLWTQITTANAPQEREDMVMSYDASTQTTVVFGGYDHDTATLLGDTWEYRGADWRLANPVSSPSPRYRCASAFDTRRQRIVMYGGYDGTNFRTETYEYTGSSWEPIAAPAGSTNCTEMYVGFDSQRNRMVTFGGVGAVFSDETWEYNGVTSAQFGAYGQGCPHSLGISTIDGNPPVLGAAFDMEVLDVPLGTGAVVVAQGFSSTTSNLGTLPFDLTPFGLVGCALEARDDAILAVLPVANAFRFGLMVPNSTALLNLSYYAQAFIPDNAAPNGLGGMSRGAHAIFGN